MDDRIEEVVKRSSEPLKDDWALAQEVAQELRTHLEDKCAELEGEGNSPEESVKKAIGEFGDPDEIGRGLLGANFRRIKLRGKLKVVLRICGLPLLLAAVWAAVDFSVLAGAARYCSVSTVNNEFSVKCDWAARFFGRFAGFRKPAGEQPLWNGGDGLNARKADEMRLELVNRHPDDPVCLANYVAEVMVRDKRPDSVKAVKLAIGREPDNALYHHLLSALIIEEAFEADRTAMEECEIKDRAKLDAAKAEYLLGLKCPYYRLYIPERGQRARSQYAGNAFHARMQQKVEALMLPIPALPRQRSVARAAIYYPELLIKDGRPEEAEALLDQWYVYPAQLLESGDLLISMLIVDTILELNQKKLPELYARVGKPEKGTRIAAKIAEARASMAAWKAQRKEADDRAQEEAERYGGIFSFYLVGLGISLPAEYLRSDRIMTYCIMDSLVLLCFTVLVLCVVGFQALCWGIGRVCGEKGHFLWLTKREYGKLLLYGMLLPAGLSWLWLHADLLSGRGVGYQANLTMFCIQSFVLVVGLPVWFRFYLGHILLRRYRALVPPGEGTRRICLPFLTYVTTAIPLWIVFLLVVGGALRFAANRELQYNVGRDRSFFAGLFSPAEDHVVQALRTDLAIGLDKAAELTRELK